jgi:diguanylate cyclase (GGDEF)-like protein
LDDSRPVGGEREGGSAQEQMASRRRRVAPELPEFLSPRFNLAVAAVGLVAVVLQWLIGPAQLDLVVVAAVLACVGLLAFASSALSRRMLVRALEWQQIRAQSRHVQLEGQAMGDDLTGLPNRRYFYARLREELELAREYRRHLAVLVLDVDGFKAINDGYGHHAGDVVLTNVGKLLTAGVRTSDVPGRIGGDEFGVIMPDTNKDGAVLVAKRLQESMDGALVFDEDGLQVYLHVSIGWSGYPWAGGTVDAIVQRADTHMYAAKVARKEAVRPS